MIWCHKAAEAITNIFFCLKGEGAVDHSTITRLKKLHSDCKTVIDRAKLVRPTGMDSEALLKRIEANTVSSIQKDSGLLTI